MQPSLRCIGHAHSNMLLINKFNHIHHINQFTGPYPLNGRMFYKKIKVFGLGPLDLECMILQVAKDIMITKKILTCMSCNQI
jgi:hypothetical protein